MALVENIKVDAGTVVYNSESLGEYLDERVGVHSTTYKNVDAAAFTKGLDDRAKSMRILSDYYEGSTIPSEIQPALQAALLEGDKLIVPDGQYALNSPVTVNHTIAGFPVMGSTPSRRFDVIGSSMPNTIFRTNGNDAFVYTGTDGTIPTQGVHSGARFENFTVYGVNNTGAGMRLTGLSYLGLKNLQFKRCNAGIVINGALTSDLERIQAEYCNYGIYFNSGAYSTANAMRIQGIFSGNNRAGIEGEVGTGLYIGPSNFEGNGRYEGAAADARGIYLRVKEPMGVINIDTPYFEAGAGEADIRIDNLTSSPIIVNIRSGVFIRGNSDGKGCTYNILGNSVGGGDIILNLEGCTFFTQTAFGYVPSASKPFIAGFTRINGLGSCHFSETTSLGTSISSASQTLGLNVAANGTVLSGPSGVTVNNTGAGIYSITSLRPFAATADGYTAVASASDSGGAVGYVQRVNQREIRLVMYNYGTGTPTNRPFSLQITQHR